LNFFENYSFFLKYAQKNLYDAWIFLCLLDFSEKEINSFRKRKTCFWLLYMMIAPANFAVC